MTNTAAAADSFAIEWDMGTYYGFATQEEARAYQRSHRMTGSTVVEVRATRPDQWWKTLKPAPGQE